MRLCVHIIFLNIEYFRLSRLSHNISSFDSKNIKSKAHHFCMKILRIEMLITGHDFYAYVCFSNNMLHPYFYHEMSLRIGFLVSKPSSLRDELPF